MGIDWRRLARILRRVERDEDLVQEVLLRLMHFPPQREETALSYALLALRSVRIGAWRRAEARRRGEAQPLCYGPSLDPGPLAALLRAQRLRELWRSIASRPSGQREAIEACLDGADGPELRRRLGAPSTGAAYNVLYRARQSLLQRYQR
jgi:DNA-directed RNA polymerase specialized sigma24 family protein